VPVFVTRLLDEAQLEAAVQRAQSELAPDVVRIRYTIGEDWTGEPSIFFRVLLSDAASRPGGLAEIALRVTARLEDEIRPDEFGFHAYHDFRSDSEQAELQDPAWA
jgi:hypothetical protein